MATKTVVGLLHPGSMGAEVGRCLVNLGHRVVWASEGRSAESSARALASGLDDVQGLATLVSQSNYIFSICPPASAYQVASDVKRLGYTGVYVDANAIAPSTSESIAKLFDAAQYVDGGIIGGPPKKAGTTRLYLSGSKAEEVSQLFDSSCPLGAVPMAGAISAASSLKMAYAAWTKGTAALLLNIRALADGAGVSEALEEEWNLSQQGLVERSTNTAATVGPKAWRWVGEMEEIAKTFEEASLPGNFHTGAAEVYTRISPLKGREASPPSLNEAMALMNAAKKQKASQL